MNKNRRKPNLFIVGAEKAGTTFLYKYLKRHPQIFFPVIKEPNYFSTDINPTYPEDISLINLSPQGCKGYVHYAYIRDENIYLELYRCANRNHLFLGDASVSYLYSKVAANEIFKFNPQSKIIIILRNPVERAYSAYKMEFGIGRVIKSFEEYLNYNNPFVERSLYFKQVSRYINKFPKDNILVLKFEDLYGDPQNIFDEIYKFLNVKKVVFDEIYPVNTSLSPRFPVLNFFLYNIGIKQKIASFTPMYVKNLFKKIYYKNKRSSLSPQTYNAFLDLFVDDIKKLESLLNMDFSLWLEKREEGK